MGKQVSLLFPWFFFVVLGFWQVKDFQKYPPNIPRSPPNPSLADFLCVDPWTNPWDLLSRGIELLVSNILVSWGFRSPGLLEVLNMLGRLNRNQSSNSHETRMGEHRVMSIKWRSYWAILLSEVVFVGFWAPALITWRKSSSARILLRISKKNLCQFIDPWNQEVFQQHVRCAIVLTISLSASAVKLYGSAV